MTKNNKTLEKDLKQFQASEKQIINKPLKLETVNEGNNEDDVLVRGADKTVKFIPRSEFGSGEENQDLQSVAETGNVLKDINIQLKNTADEYYEANLGYDLFQLSNVQLNQVNNISSEGINVTDFAFEESMKLKKNGLSFNNNNNRNLLSINPSSTGDSQILLPVSNGSTKTLASLDDISEAGNLQKVLENGGTYIVDDANKTRALSLFDNSIGENSVIIQSKDKSLATKQQVFTLSPDLSALSGFSNNTSTQFAIIGEKASISETNALNGASLKLELETATEAGQTKVLVPAKAPRFESDGTTPIPYTLATLDDISEGSSQNLYSVMNKGSNAIVDSMIYMETSDSVTGGLTSIAMFPNIVNENVTGMALSTEGMLNATGKSISINSSLAYGSLDMSSVGLTLNGNDNKVFVRGTQGVQIDGLGGGISINSQGGVINMTHFLGAKINDKNIITSIDGVEAGLDGSANLLGVSSTQSGIVNNTVLQELGGVDKTINDVRIGRGNSNISSNTVVGFGGLLNNSTGRYNAAVGLGGLSLNTTGEQNSAFGYTALYRNSTGNNNTGIGISSLYNNQTGSNNTAIGAAALAGNTSQTSLSNARNTAIGAGAGLAIRTGSDNVLIGGDNPLATNSGLMNGNKNVEIGKLNNLHQNGDNNVLIGWANAPSTTLNNNVIISDGAGNVAIRKTDTNQLLAPTLTKALVISGGLNSLVNKDYADNNLPTMVTLNAAPTSATATGVKGDIRIDNDYFYVCVNTNTWKRSALTTW